MKVLYIGSEQAEARSIAQALDGVGPGLSVLWAAQLTDAATWLGEGHGLDALVMEAPIDGASCLVVMQQLQRLAVPPAVVFIVPDGIAPTLDSLHPGALYVPRTARLARDLAVAVTRALERGARVELERKLAQADKVLADQQAKYDIGMARATAAWDMVDEQLRSAALQVERARQGEAAAAADAERLSRRESELSGRLADADAALGALERELRQAADERRGLEERLAQAVHVREDAERRHQAAADDVLRLTAREAALSEQLAESAASRSDLEGRLSATEAAFDDAVTRATRERLAASTKAAEREAELDGQIRQGLAARAGLEHTLAEVTAAFDQARHEHGAVVADLARATQRDADLSSQLASVQAAREMLDRQLADATVALHDAQQRHDAALAAAAADQVEQRRRYEHELSQGAAERDALEHRLRDTASSLDQSQRDQQIAAAAIERLTRREVELSSRLADLQTARESLDRELADAANTLRDAQQRHEAALSSAAVDLAEQRSRYEQELSQEAADRSALERRYGDAESALEQARRDQQIAAIEIDRLTQREVELASRLADIQTTRDLLDRQLVDATDALHDAQQRHEAALSSAAADLAEQRARHEQQLSQETAERSALAHRLSDVESSLEEARRNQQVAATEIERWTQREAELVSRLGNVEASRNALERELAIVTEQLQHDRSMRAGLEQTIAETNTALEQARRDHHAATADVERLTQNNADLASDLDDARANADALGHQLADATSALSDAVARAAQLEREIEDQRTARRALEQTHADALAQVAEQRQQLEVQIAQDQLEHETRMAELTERTDALTLERDQLQQALAAQQDQSRQLQQSLSARDDAFAASRAENQRLFDQAGVAMFRCTPDGALLDANRACTSLIGHRTIDEVEGTGFAAAVFEAPQALSWLIERCVSARTRESIETTWRRPDGGRLFMRLSARLLPAGTIEVVAEDLTRLRVLEERLGQAHRMEAVGRLASEVAVTCGSLLGNLQQQARDWVESSHRDAVARQRGEQLFDDIGRAAGFLRELAAYSDEQARTPMLVDLNTLVRDFAPVLKNVAGADVEVCLRDTTTALNVDVGAERVERLLVNLASYGRGRMRPGGRLRIELGTSVVDRHFSAKHPNVRLGLHALITVTETRRTGHDDGASPRAPRRPDHRPGVDFATLQELVSDCGGHLWITVQPLGAMAAKIRLPLYSSRDQHGTRASVSRGRGERQATR